MRTFTFTLAIALAVSAALVRPAPADAAIHEIVASFCSGRHVQDPPGQLNTQGNSFLRALQASGVYTVEPGTDQAGEFGLDLSTGAFGPLPGAGAGTIPVSVFADASRPSAKLGDFLFWVRFVEPELGLTVYLEVYELEHPAFTHCPRFGGGH